MAMSVVRPGAMSHGGTVAPERPHVLRIHLDAVDAQRVGRQDPEALQVLDRRAILSFNGDIE